MYYHHLNASRVKLLENRLRIQEEMMYRHHDKFMSEISEVKKSQKKIEENQKTIIFLLKRNDNQISESNIKKEIDDPGYWHLQGTPITEDKHQDSPQQTDGPNDIEPGEAMVVDDDEVRILKFLDLTRDQEYRKLATQRRNRIVAQLQSENETKQEPAPFSVQDKKNLLRYMKSRTSETVIGPPESPAKFQEMYPGIGPWNSSMTRLGDFSDASRRNTIKNAIDGDLKLPTIPEEIEKPLKRKKTPKNDEGPSSKRFKPSKALKTVGRKFTKFDDDLHEYMAQDERESKYSDEIFDSDDDSDGFEPKCKTKSKKKKSNKRSI